MYQHENAEGISPRRLLPTIRRAREYHLYDDRGRRYLDLHQDGGRAILGHRPSGFLTRVKNEMSRGVLMSAPAPAEARLQTELLRDYPGYTRAALVEAAALPRLLADLLQLLDQDPRGARLIYDPAAPPGAEAVTAPVALARPFLPVPAAPILLPILPLPGFFACQALLIRVPRAPDETGIAGEVEQRLLREAPAAPPTLRACEMALQGLRRAREEAAPGWEAEALAPLWESRGPYLRFCFGATAYPEVFRTYRDGGYLLSPAFGEPSIVPRMYTEGELAGFLRLTRRIAETLRSDTRRSGDESTSS